MENDEIDGSERGAQLKHFQGNLEGKHERWEGCRGRRLSGCVSFSAPESIVCAASQNFVISVA